MAIASNIPKWTGDTYWVDNQEFPIPDTLMGQPLFAQGDTSIVFYKNPLPAGSRARLQENCYTSISP